MEDTASRQDYEFDSSEETVIAGTARWVAIWAWFAIVSGGFTAVGGLVTLPDGVGGLVFGIVYLVVGVYFRGAARSLRRVVETSGADVAHLVSALASLQSAFRVMVIVTAVGIVLGFIVALAAAV